MRATRRMPHLSSDELAAEFVLDMDADDVVERSLGSGETELTRALGFEVARPAVDNTHDEGIRFAFDAGGDLVAGDPLQGCDLFADGRRQTGHGEVTARP